MKRKNLMTTVIVFVFAVSIVVGGFMILKSPTHTNTGDTDFDRKTITVDGVEYFPRQDISTFLILGIDKNGVVESSHSYRNDRNADVIMLMILDENNETYDVLCLNRDTMTQMEVLGLGGVKAGKAKQQLALAHTYGTGLEDSSEHMKETVSSLLNNILIDNYITMNMDGIEIVTDSLGGVEVNVTDDFSKFDSSIKLGKQLLTGKQAAEFVRVRKDMGDQLNSSRMLRQKEYLKGLEKAFKDKSEIDEKVLKNVYDQLSSYMVTDCSLTKLSSLVDKYINYELDEIIIPDGEYKKGHTYLEYYLDEEKFNKMIIELLYAKKK